MTHPVDVFAATFTRLDQVVADLSDADLLAPSRCRGWAVCDVLTHLHLGLQEMITGFAYPTSEPADTDLSTYWHRDGAPDPLPGTRFVRLLASAYGHPTGLVSHLRPTLNALMRFTDAMGRADQRVRFQGRVLPLADFITTWVVEGAVHHLDLMLELDLPGPPPEALALIARTLDGLGPRAPGWDDVTYALKGSGRSPLTPAEGEFLGSAASLYPLLA